jgi:CRP-like cAMP-binding protein
VAQPVPDSILAVVETLPVFAGRRLAEVRQLVRRGTSLAVPPGYVLTREGRRGYELFVIVDGQARWTGDGGTDGWLGPGDVFGQTAPVGLTPREATVVAADAMTVLVLDVRAVAAVQPS